MSDEQTSTREPVSTREALLDAAERLFSAKGYAAVGIREIANLAGANVASIKYYFGSKHDLYLETVRHAMAAHGADALWDVLSEQPADRLQAAAQLVRFIRTFFRNVQRQPMLDACGLLMIREALQPSEAIDAVVADYLQPSVQPMRDLLNVLLPDASPDRIERCCTLLLGQLMHLKVFRPFIERLSGIDMRQPQHAEQMIREASLLALRGLGCDDEYIARAIEQAGGCSVFVVEENER